MKVIFLDLDGVANSNKFITHLRQTNSPIRYKPDQWIDPVAVERLNRITDTTKANIVISSSWRLDFPGTTGITNHLKPFGITGKIIGVTKYLGADRGSEIQRYLDENKDKNIDKFIILDDNSDMEDLIDYLIQTSFEDGLLDEHVELAIKLLND